MHVYIPGSNDSSINIFPEIPFVLDRDFFKELICIKYYPELEGEVDSFFSEAYRTAHPKAVYRECYIDDIHDDVIRIAEASFSSSVLKDLFLGVKKVFPYIITCGTELDEIDISPYDSTLSALWMSVLKMQAITAASDFLTQKLKADYTIKILSSINPGSGDMNIWPLNQQKELFALFGDTESMIGVNLTECSLMIPDKTVSGIFFSSEIEYSNCQSCTRKDCPTRRKECSIHR